MRFMVPLECNLTDEGGYISGVNSSCAEKAVYLFQIFCFNSE